MIWIQCQHFLIVALLFAGGLIGAASQDLNSWLRPGDSECIPCADKRAPGIGFDLTPGYATAVLNYRNGSIINVGKIEGTREWEEVMSRLSHFRPGIPCYENSFRRIQCDLVRRRRQLNKKLGLPASHESEVVGKMFIQLRELVESRLGKDSCKRVRLTKPTHLRLSWEETKDAMEYVGLGRLPGCGHGDPLMETNAAYAGMGFGLCKHFDDNDTCIEEERHRPETRGLGISFTHKSISVTDMWMPTVWHYFESYKIRFDLGLQDLPESFEAQEAYWGSIRDLIVSVAQGIGPITHLLLLGEDADEPRFIETVKEAIRQLAPGQPSSIGLETLQEVRNPLYVAARGAAEFAKRCQASPRGWYSGTCCEVDQFPSEVAGEDEDVPVEIPEDL